MSIVTPAYNQDSYLRETIESVLAQDHAPIEYIVIDDGSTDKTPDILAAYGERFIWLRQGNLGQTATINRGFEMSQGEILGWLNSDDTLLPGAVSAAVDYLRRHPDVDIVFGDTLFTDAGGRPLRRSAPREAFDYETFVLSAENPIPQPSAFIRRRVIESEGLLDATLTYFMDWDFWLRSGLRHRIAYSAVLLSTYRLHAASNTVARTARLAPELERVYQKYFTRPDLPARIRARRRQAMANMLFTTGGYFVEGSDEVGAARSAGKALRLWPAFLLGVSGWRKLLYCLFGTSRLYRNARKLHRRKDRVE